MTSLFEELAWHDTPMGELTLRRRREPTRQVDVYEVRLGDEYLMSSLFTVGEVALARLGLAPLAGEDLYVVVGGLGLGYTARAVLEDPRVGSLVVVEAQAEVIDWHRRDLLPDTVGLAADERTRLVHGDFFALAASDEGFVIDGRRPDAILVDIDHTPRHLLASSHATFYSAEGLGHLGAHLQPGGVFALWSDDPPDDDFVAVLDRVFAAVDAHVVAFPNFLTGDESTNTVYVAKDDL